MALIGGSSLLEGGERFVSTGALARNLNNFALEANRSAVVCKRTIIDQPNNQVPVYNTIKRIHIPTGWKGNATLHKMQNTWCTVDIHTRVPDERWDFKGTFPYVNGSYARTFTFAIGLAIGVNWLMYDYLKFDKSAPFLSGVMSRGY